MLTFHAHSGRDRTMTRLVIRALVVLALLACAAAPAFAGSDERKGTGGALELRLPVGARGTALGGSVVGDITGIEALFWNPAGLASIEHTEAMFSHTKYFADQKLNYAAVATHLGFCTIAFNAKVLSVGDVIVTTEDAPEGTGEILSPTFTVIGLSFARQFTDRVLFGMTTDFVNERIQNVGASGLAFDFGVQYLTGYNGLRFGMVMKNFGPSMEYSGDNFNVNFRPPDTDPTASNRTFSSTSAAFELPSYFTLGANYDLVNNANARFTVMTAFQNNNFVGDNLSAGAEWNYRKSFQLRGSYFGSVNTTNDPLSGNSSSKINSGDDLYSGWAFGAGAQVQAGGSKLGVDVAWRGVRQFFDDTVEVGLKLSF